VRSEDLRAFANRDWARVERAKLDFWASRHRKHGPAAAIRAADMLRQQVFAFASQALPAQRREDLAHHIRLKQRIDAASAWFRS
jgi:hypothetical protein